LFIDLSARNLALLGDRANDKVEVSKIFARAWRVAKQNQPAVIYVDQADSIFFGGGKIKGLVKDPLAKRYLNFIIFSKKKQISSFKKLILPDYRIIIIMCTNKPYAIKDLKVFDQTFYFGLPSLSDSYRIWKTVIEKKVGRSYDLEYDVLAKLSKGFSAEAVKF
jgi:SpoVK/Ycf46/Vps4 family AAA+-type ATPase